MGSVTGRPLVIGIGNRNRGDDALGPIVAERVAEMAPGKVWVRETRGDPASLLGFLENTETAYLVDAATSGTEPGTVHRFDVGAGPLPEHLFALSSHGFGVGQVIELARTLEVLPAVCLVFAVEGAVFEYGRPLSVPVCDAISRVVECILAEIRMPA